MGRVTKVSGVSRRSFLKSAGAIVSTSALPASAISLLAFSKTSESAVEAGTVIAVASAAASLFRKADGAAKRMAALNLKLDQIQDNQVIIHDALIALAGEISKLPSDVAAQFTNESYRRLWEDADGMFRSVNQVIRPDATAAEKRNLYEGAFEELDKRISQLASRINTTTTKNEGLVSVMSAGKAFLLYSSGMFALANFEVNLPDEHRWKANRSLRFKYMSENMQEALTLLMTKRIPEAVSEQELFLKQAPQYQGPWKPVHEQMLEFAKRRKSTFADGDWRKEILFLLKKPEIPVSDETVKRDVELLLVDLRSPDFWGTGYVTRTRSDKGGGGEYEMPVRQLRFKTLSFRFWYERHILLQSGDVYFINPEIAELSGGELASAAAGPQSSYPYVTRNGKAVPIDQSALFGPDLSEFKAALLAHTKLVLNLQILRDLTAACEDLLRDSRELEGQIVEKSKSVAGPASSPSPDQAETMKSLLERLEDPVP